MAEFYLVQRLENAHGREPNPFGSDPRSAKTLFQAGADVDLAYMGRAEFEFGEIPASGNRITSVARGLKIVTQQLVTPSGSEDVHFVCTPSQENDVLPKWHQWTERHHTIEPLAYFRGDPDDSMGVVRPEEVVGWWALREDLVWTRELDVAERIKNAFLVLAGAETPV